MARVSRRHFLATSAGALLAVGAPRIGHGQTAIKVGTAVLADYALAGPFIVAVEKGFFRTEGLAAEFVPFRGGPDLVKAVIAGDVLLGAAGSTDIFVAREAGQPLKMVATHTEGNHFTLNVAPEIQAPIELKGKTISIGGPKDITRIYLERMAAPNGLKAGDYDTVFAGATSARFSALQSGAVDAAILLPPFNFYAESAGFTNLGLTIDYAKELPFTGTVVGRALASARKAVLDKVLLVNSKSMAWFSDPANRTEAIKIMVEASRLKEEDVAKSYDFLHENQFFEKTGMVSKTKMDALLNALKSLGDIEGPTNIERFILPGVSQLTD